MQLRKKSELLDNRVKYIAVEDIAPNPQQPRQQFDPRGLEELAQSIRQYGILQPLTVRCREGRTELIAGERRLRAAKMAGLRRVPCLTAYVEEPDAGLLALMENLQRRDLHFMEEAAAIGKLIERYHFTQEQVAQRLGKSQSAVANKLRLLRLPPEVCDMLLRFGLTERHARALLRLSDAREQMLAAQAIGERKLTVAQAEAYVERRLHDIQATPPHRRPSYVIKDVRLFLNSLQRQVQLMQKGGVPAQVERQDGEDTIVVTIRIPTKARKVVADK